MTWCAFPGMQAMATRRRWGQFLRARRLEIAGALRGAHDQEFLRLVEELRLNGEFEARIDRRGRRTERFMESAYREWVDTRREPGPLVPRKCEP
jgi:hypothetical protein